MTVLGAVVEPHAVHLVMEQCNRSLRDLISSSRYKDRVSIALRAQLASQVCKGVSFLHSRPRPVFHSDLKPENVLVRWASFALGLRALCERSLCSSLYSHCVALN